MMKKAFSIVTAFSFIFSFVLAEPLLASLQGAAETTRDFRKLLDDSFIPPAVGRVTQARDCGSDTVIVTIQDLHCHPEVQRNISRIIASLDRSSKLSAVYVEGASGSIDTVWPDGIADRKLRTSLVESLLAQGKLTGTEYYAITSGKQYLLKGVENDGLYRANYVRLGRLMGKKAEYEKLSDSIDRDLVAIKKRYFDARNKKLDRIVESYRKGEMKPAKYYKLLEKFARKLDADCYTDCPSVATINFDSYRNLRAYCALIDTGKRLDSKAVNRELSRFIGVLKDHISYSAFKLLAQRTDNFSRLDDLYESLSNIAGAYHLDLERNYPHLNAFFTYLSLSKQINPLELINEEKRLVRDLRVGFTGDVSELEVSFLADFAPCFRDFVTNKLSADDYEYFRDRFGEFKLLWGKYGRAVDFAAYEPDFRLLTEYYDTNLQRNNAFIENVLGGEQQVPAVDASLPKDNPGDAARLIGAAQHIVVIVTGGFHSEGVRKLLDKRGITHLTITPNVTQDVEQADLVYGEIIRQQSRILSASFANTPFGKVVQMVNDSAKQSPFLCLIAAEIIEASSRNKEDIKTNLTAVLRKWVTDVRVADGRTTIKFEGIDEPVVFEMNGDKAQLISAPENIKTLFHADAAQAAAARRSLAELVGQSAGEAADAVVPAAELAPVAPVVLAENLADVVPLLLGYADLMQMTDSLEQLGADERLPVIAQSLWDRLFTQQALSVDKMAGSQAQDRSGVAKEKAGTAQTELSEEEIGRELRDAGLDPRLFFKAMKRRVVGRNDPITREDVKRYITNAMRRELESAGLDADEFFRSQGRKRFAGKPVSMQTVKDYIEKHRPSESEQEDRQAQTALEAAAADPANAAAFVDKLTTIDPRMAAAGIAAFLDSRKDQRESIAGIVKLLAERLTEPVMTQLLETASGYSISGGARASVAALLLQRYENPALLGTAKEQLTTTVLMALETGDITLSLAEKKALLDYVGEHALPDASAALATNPAAENSAMETLRRGITALRVETSEGYAAQEADRKAYAATLFDRLASAVANDTFGKDASAVIVAQFSEQLLNEKPAPAYRERLVDFLVSGLRLKNTLIPSVKAALAETASRDEVVAAVRSASARADYRLGYLLIGSKSGSAEVLTAIAEDASVDTRLRMYALLFTFKVAHKDAVRIANTLEPAAEQFLGQLFSGNEADRQKALGQLADNYWLQNEELRMFLMAGILAAHRRTPGVDYVIHNDIWSASIGRYRRAADAGFLFRGDFIKGSMEQFVGTIMHELGHNFLHQAGFYEGDKLLNKSIHELISDLYALAVLQDANPRADGFVEGFINEKDWYYDYVARDGRKLLSADEEHIGARATLRVLINAFKRLGVTPQWDALLLAARETLKANGNQPSSMRAFVYEVIKRYAGRENLDERFDRVLENSALLTDGDKVRVPAMYTVYALLRTALAAPLGGILQQSMAASQKASRQSRLMAFNVTPFSGEAANTGTLIGRAIIPVNNVDQVVELYAADVNGVPTIQVKPLAGLSIDPYALDLAMRVSFDRQVNGNPQIKKRLRDWANRQNKRNYPGETIRIAGFKMSDVSVDAMLDRNDAEAVTQARSIVITATLDDCRGANDNIGIIRSVGACSLMLEDNLKGYTKGVETVVQKIHQNGLAAMGRISITSERDARFLSTMLRKGRFDGMYVDLSAAKGDIGALLRAIRGTHPYATFIVKLPAGAVEAKLAAELDMLVEGQQGGCLSLEAENAGALQGAYALYKISLRQLAQLRQQGALSGKDVISQIVCKLNLDAIKAKIVETPQKVFEFGMNLSYENLPEASVWEGIAAVLNRNGIDIKAADGAISEQAIAELGKAIEGTSARHAVLLKLQDLLKTKDAARIRALLKAFRIKLLIRQSFAQRGRNVAVGFENKSFEREYGELLLQSDGAAVLTQNDDAATLIQKGHILAYSGNLADTQKVIAQLAATAKGETLSRYIGLVYTFTQQGGTLSEEMKRSLGAIEANSLQGSAVVRYSALMQLSALTGSEAYRDEAGKISIPGVPRRDMMKSLQTALESRPGTKENTAGIQPIIDQIGREKEPLAIADLVEALAQGALAGDNALSAEDIATLSHEAVLKIKQSEYKGPQAQSALMRVLDLCSDTRRAQLIHEQQKGINVQSMMGLLGAA